MTLKSINPADGSLLTSYEALTPEQVERKLGAAETAFRQWRRSDFDARSAVLRRAADILEAEKDDWGRLMTLEMGKPIKQAVGEVEKCAMTCRYFADAGPTFLADEAVETDSDSAIRYLPLGVLLAIMPWNFPFWQVIRCLAPALMAGNAVVLKHASNVPQCALALEEIMRRAGLPEGVFQTLLIGSAQVAPVIRDRRITAVTLTGSEAAGASVAAVAGEVLKKCVLELGGNDPFIVLPSADLDAAVATGVQARVMNNGQSCVCAKRFIVHEDVYDVPPEAPAYSEEVFGPAAVLFRVRDLDEAIRLANDSPYGLGSSVWTGDPAESARCVNDLEAGLTFVNAMVASDPRLPFGGVKHSGFGRELGRFGAREFTNIKTVVTAPARAKKAAE